MTDTKERFDTINTIADAALRVLRSRGCQTDKLATFMDIDNVDLVCPLDLDAMAKASYSDERRFDFTHDVIGIWNHFDRETKTLKDGFLPRFAR